MTNTIISQKRLAEFQKIATAACIVTVLFTIFLAPAFRSAKSTAQSHVCTNNLKRLSQALAMYAQDWDAHYPPANAWMDCIDKDKYLGPDRTAVFHCPAANSQYGYAMNAFLSGRSDRDIDNVDTVLLFETDSPTRNAGGTQNSIALRRHGLLNCTFCGGSMAWVNLYTQNHWKWKVPGH